MIINLSIKKKVFIKPKFTQTKSKDFNSLPYTERMYLSGSKILNWIHIGPIKEALYLSNIEKKDLCLDIGSSEGILLPSLNEYSGNSVGIDINLQYLQRAKGLKLKNVNIINANILHLPFKENYFTKIFCLDILEHVTNQNNAMKEIKRVINNNGICIIDLPVEFGFSLLLKQLFASIFKFPRDKYSYKELFIACILQKPKNILKEDYEYLKNFPEKNIHKGYDYRDTIKLLVKNGFRIIKKKRFPINILGDFLATRICLKVKKV